MKNYHLIFPVLLAPMIFGCENQSNNIKNSDTISANSDTADYSSLRGNWVSHTKEGFSLIEIQNSANVVYYNFIDRRVIGDSLSINRYWYYKSPATLGYHESPSRWIWISTKHFRFDYKLKGDTLIEVDKMGEQRKFIKVSIEKEYQ